MNFLAQALAGRIQEKLSDNQQTVSRTVLAMVQVKTTSDDLYFDAIALNLHGFYTRVEHIFEDIAQNWDGFIPKGGAWHSELLVQMSSETALRPRVIKTSTRRCLEEYRSLRHVIRNVYAFNLRSTRLIELAEGVESCFQQLGDDLANFIAFLEKQSVDLSSSV